MGVKPELAFDVCWEVYKKCREVLESIHGVGALNLEEVTKYLWRPGIRARIGEFVADFALAGKSALEGPDHASRLLLFRLYYLGMMPYERARHFLGVSETNWVQWTEEIRRRCGRELRHRAMFPPRRYFREAA
jgi:hypothetical protein